MSSLNDLWVTYLKGLGYTSNSLPDLMREALADQASSSSKNINDLWRDFLAAQGYTGAVPQALYEYLGGLGYTGNLNDRLSQSISTGDFFGPADGPYAYRLNASSTLIEALGPGSTKMTTSADEQTGTFSYTFSGSPRQGVIAGNIETESPLSVNYLNDMSYGNGDFVYELHVTWPETTGALSETYGSFAQLTNLSGVFLQMGAYIAPGETTVVTGRIYDDTVNTVKRYSVWTNGLVTAEGLEVGTDVGVGIDLSTLYGVVYTQEPAGSTTDQASFVDATPQIVSRFVTDPAEMVYAQYVIAEDAQTIVGSGTVTAPTFTISAVTNNTTVQWGTVDSVVGVDYDTMINSSNNTTNYYSGTDYYDVTKWDVGNTVNYIYAADLSAIKSTLDNAVILDAKLRIKSYSSGSVNGDASFTIGAYGLNPPGTMFLPQVTWDEYQTGQSWTTSGAWDDLYQTDPYAETGVGPVPNTWFTWDVTELVREAIQTRDLSLLSILMERSDINEHSHADSYIGQTRRFYADTSTDGSRPELIITYSVVA